MKELFEQIESLEFSVAANYSQGIKDFVYNVTHEKVFDEMLAGSAGRIIVGQDICERAISLASTSVDPRYENPHDAAIAAYLIALSMLNYDFAQLVAYYAYEIQNVWWAKKIATQITEKTLNNSMATQNTISGSRMEQTRDSITYTTMGIVGSPNLDNSLTITSDAKNGLHNRAS